MPADEGEGFWRDMLKRDEAGRYEDSATVAALCLEAGKPDLIPFFLRAKLTANAARQRLAAPPAGSSANGRRSVTPAELEGAAQARFRAQNASDPLAAALQKRFEQRR